MNLSYYNKYIKYKHKYTRYKMQTGGYDDKIISISIQEKYLDLIKSGDKQVEGRLNRSIFKNIRVGDQVSWTWNNKKVCTEIIYIHKYESFQDMLEQEKLSRVLPGINNIQDGIKIYDQFYHEKIKEIDDRYKILAFGLKLKD